MPRSDERCDTCRHWHGQPAGRVPGAGPLSQRCNVKRIEKPIFPYRGPSDWCDRWQPKESEQ